MSDRSDESCRIVFISDTHSLHNRLGVLPEGDILVHAGDFTRSRPAKPEEYKEFSDWLVAQPHSHKVLISGNRDQLMDTAAKHEPCERFWMRQMQDYVKGDKSVVYLEDEEHVINLNDDFSIKVYGSPWTAIHGQPGKSFQIPRPELKDKWEKIPRDVDILVTHGPPHGIRDENAGKVNAGCKDLERLVTERLRPRIHVFGHIHEGYGWINNGKTLFINASIQASRIKAEGSSVNSPIVVDYYKDGRELRINTQ